MRQYICLYLKNHKDKATLDKGQQFFISEAEGEGGGEGERNLGMTRGTLIRGILQFLSYCSL